MRTKGSNVSGALVSCQGLYTPFCKFFLWTTGLKNQGVCGLEEGGQGTRWQQGQAGFDGPGAGQVGGAVIGLELDKLELPQACSWVGIEGQRVSPGTWGAGISGMWPQAQGSRDWSSSPGLGGWVGPKFKHRTLGSPSALVCPTPAPCSGPSQWGIGLRRGVGLHSHFQVFPALGQPGSLTNQLLQAQRIGGGVQPEANRPAPGCRCGRIWLSWGCPRGSLTHGCCSS